MHKHDINMELKRLREVKSRIQKGVYTHSDNLAIIEVLIKVLKNQRLSEEE